MERIELNISNDDVKNLRSALEKYIAELSSEIADTDSKDFRDSLKSERISLQKILVQLEKTK
jgi:hypothetical protein